MPGVGYTSENYPGTVHGFTMSDIDALGPAGLKCHWDRLLPSWTRCASGRGRQANGFEGGNLPGAGDVQGNEVRMEVVEGGGDHT